MMIFNVFYYFHGTIFFAYKQNYSTSTVKPENTQTVRSDW